jgi:SNF2 family DNA or RNA helicase
MDAKTASTLNFLRTSKISFPSGEGNTTSVLFSAVDKKTNEPNIPYRHQIDAMQAAVRLSHGKKNRIILNHHMGLGKTTTGILIWILRSLMFGKQPRKCSELLVVCPMACKNQWRDTILKLTNLPESEIVVQGTRNANPKPLVTISTPQTICKRFKETHQYYPDLNETEDSSGRIRYKGGWDVKGKRKIAPGLYEDPLEKDMPQIGPLFKKQKFVILDELHEYRREKTVTCNALAELTAGKEFVVGCTGTMIVNGLFDLQGEIKAMNIDLEGADSLSNKDMSLAQKVKVVDRLDEWVHRVEKSVESLPPVHRKAVNCNLHIPNRWYFRYYSKYTELKNIYTKIEEDGNSGDDMVLFLTIFKQLQLLAFHPALYEHGVKLFEKPELLEAATEPEQYSGAISCILDTLKKLQADGHTHIIVTSMLLQPMRLIRKILAKERERGVYNYGPVYKYSGNMTLEERDQAKKSYLARDKGILFLSAKAGGLGLDGLQTKTEAMVFMGFHPWNDATTKQVEARILRTGQTASVTGRVSIVHIACQGGADYAVGGVFKDKVRIAKCVDNTLGRTMTTNDLLRTLRVMDRLVEPHKHPDGFLHFQPADPKATQTIFDREFIPTVLYE